jgi:hypothetical protein
MTLGGGPRYAKRIKGLDGVDSDGRTYSDFMTREMI